MTAPVFVDTCVFLYAHDESEPDKRPRARTWLEHLWQEMAGRTSIQVLSEYYLTVSRKLLRISSSKPRYSRGTLN